MLRSKPRLAWADLWNRWSVEMESSVGSPGEIREWCDSLPFSPVVWSTLIHCIYILCIHRLLCLLETVNFDGMLSGYCWHLAPAPWDECACVCVPRESVWQVTAASWPCFLSGIVGMCILVAAAVTVLRIVSAHSDNNNHLNSWQAPCYYQLIFKKIFGHFTPQDIRKC